jgi:hypothetical protein
MIAGRDEGFIAAHTAHDMAAMVRTFTKWDAQPKTLEESLTALQRAYKALGFVVGISMTMAWAEVEGFRVVAR